MKGTDFADENAQARERHRSEQKGHASGTHSRGRGRGRPSARERSYNPYMMSINIKYTFQPEAKIYSKEEYNNLIANQKGEVLVLKQKNGWFDGCTPLPGFHIN